jgi:quercetin dioxygenase-like cupin family protein
MRDIRRRTCFESEVPMAQHPTQIRLNPSEETIHVGQIQIRFLLTGSESHGSAALFEMLLPAGVGLPAPPHRHDAYEETVYGLSGVSTWTVDGVVVEVNPGQALCIPRGAVHAFANDHPVEAKALLILSPAAIGPAYFREVATVIEAAAGGPPDKEKMVEIMRRHGLTPVPLPAG